MGSTPGSVRSPGEGHGNLLHYCCQENPTDRGIPLVSYRPWSRKWAQHRLFLACLYHLALVLYKLSQIQWLETILTYLAHGCAGQLFRLSSAGWLSCFQLGLLMCPHQLLSDEGCWPRVVSAGISSVPGGLSLSSSLRWTFSHSGSGGSIERHSTVLQAL